MGLSTVLVAGALVLVLAIALGNSMGNRVFGQASDRLPVEAITPAPTAIPSSGGEAAARVGWKRSQVISVATDPGFPDPRVTPEPPPPAPPATLRPHPALSFPPLPAFSPDSSDEPEAEPTTRYTSPPMPLPLASHLPGETPAPDDYTPTPVPSRPPPSRVMRGDRSPAIPEYASPTLTPP